MASLAKDYLGCLGASAIVERDFSAAGEVCTAARGGLASRTMERSISSRLWMTDGVQPNEEFREAASNITFYVSQNLKHKSK